MRPAPNIHPSDAAGSLLIRYRNVHSASASKFDARQAANRGAGSQAKEAGPESQNRTGSRGSAKSLPWILASAAGIATAGTTYAWQDRLASSQLESTSAPDNGSCSEVKWVQQIAAGSETSLVLSASAMHNHPLLKKDHLFSELHNNSMIEDLVCFYCAPEKRLDYVIQLGKNVCGFPKIVHGGLTAAIIDESFGFLWLSLRANKQLSFIGPAFTAHLEVDYKQKIPAGKLLLCKTEVEHCENRKLWMKATVCDGETGKVYAKARALFVCPRTRKLIQEGVKYAYHHFFS